MMRTVLLLCLALGCTGTLEGGGERPGKGGVGGGAAEPFEPTKFACDAQQTPTELPLRRLTRRQYVNSLTDVLGRSGLSGADLTAVQNIARDEVGPFPEDRLVGVPGEKHGGFSRLDQALQQGHVDISYNVANALGRELTSSVNRRRALVGACATDTNTANDAQCLRDFIGRFPALRPHFDYCVIDTGPKWDELTLSAMAVADAVIAPVQVAEDSVECAKMLLTALRKAEAARAGRKIAFLGLLPSMVNPFDRREMENAVKLAHAVGEKLMFPAFIKARPTYKHAAENHRPVWQENGSGAKAAAEEIRAVLAEIERRMTSQEVVAA